MDSFKIIRLIALIVLSALTLGMIPIILIGVSGNWKEFKDYYWETHSNFNP